MPPLVYVSAAMPRKCATAWPSHDESAAAWPPHSLLLLQIRQPALRLRVIRIHAEDILVAGLRARDHPFHFVQIAERDQYIHVLGIDRQRFLRTLRGIAAPFRIALLTRSEEVPGGGVVGRELHGLFEQHDRAIEIVFRRQLPRSREILFGDRALREPLLQRVVGLP